jgi:uncharacterized protein
MRELNDAQKKRINDEHRISVVQLDDGQLEFRSEDIITPKGLFKKNKIVTVAPDPDETVITVDEAKYLFQELKQMNIILTNACNLACTYCYEQHNKDFGRFTEETLLKTYRFLASANNRQRKVFDFFGGEPLIHKDLILNFLRNNKEELEENSKGEFNTVVGMTTNGLLITPELYKEYLDYKFTYFLISLDTDRAEVDHREIGQERINKLLDMISDMPQEAKDEKRVTIRATLAQENAPYLRSFIDNLYDRGIRRMVIHPLVLDSKVGFIDWDKDLWDGMHRDIVEVLNKYEDFDIKFAEGVGQKKEENCMIGADMIAMDGSGDFSGCYFFTNRKAQDTGKMMLGNLFQDRIYIDRYKSFQKEYLKMFEEEEQCKTCDYKNACYQCPAGNLDTGSGKMFRPDSMCQRIVKLALDLQDDVTKKQFKKKYDQIVQAYESEGENSAAVKGLMYLFFYNEFGYHPKAEVVHTGIEGIDYKQLLGVFYNHLLKTEHGYYTQDNFVSQVKSKLEVADEFIAIDDFYYWILRRIGQTPSVRKAGKTMYERAFFLTLLHMMFLQDPHKVYEDTFSERLTRD